VTSGRIGGIWLWAALTTIVGIGVGGAPGISVPHVNARCASLECSRPKFSWTVRLVNGIEELPPNSIKSLSRTFAMKINKLPPHAEVLSK
jgi:hypothetical protein